MRFFYLILLFNFCFSNLLAQQQIVVEIIESDSKATVVCVTNEGAWSDLLYSINSKEGAEQILDFDAHNLILENYFNEKFQLEINGKLQQLETEEVQFFGDKNLVQLKTKEAIGLMKSFAVRSQLFDFYRSTNTTVLVKNGINQQWDCQLTKEKNQCNSAGKESSSLNIVNDSLGKDSLDKESVKKYIEQLESESEEDKLEWWYYLPLVLLLPIIYLTIFPQKPKLPKEQKQP